MRAQRNDTVLIALLCALALCWAGAGRAEAQNAVRAVISRVGPAYPEIARQMHLQGEVTVEVTVSPAGDVKAAKVVGGHPLLAEEARLCVMKWRFMPAAKTATFAVQVVFELE